MLTRKRIIYLASRATGCASGYVSVFNGRIFADISPLEIPLAVDTFNLQSDSVLDRQHLDLLDINRSIEFHVNG